MRQLFFFTTAVFIFLLLTVEGNAQNNPDGNSTAKTDTAGKMIPGNNLTVLSKKDSLKLIKKARKKNDANDTINPYQPNNNVKTIPYNSPSEKGKTVGKPILADIIREVITEKKRQ